MSVSPKLALLALACAPEALALVATTPVRAAGPAPTTTAAASPASDSGYVHGASNSGARYAVVLTTPNDDESATSDIISSVLAAGMEVELGAAADASGEAAELALVAAIERSQCAPSAIFESPTCYGATPSELAGDAGVFRFQRGVSMYKRVAGDADVFPAWIQPGVGDETGRAKAGLGFVNNGKFEGDGGGGGEQQAKPPGLDTAPYTVDGKHALGETACREAADLVAEHGVALVRNAVPSELLERCADAVAARFAACEARLAERGVKLSEKFNYEEIACRNSGRYDMKVEGDAAIEELIEKGPWRPLLSRLLGPEYVSLYQSAIVSVPGAGQQALHSDNGHLFGLEGTQVPEAHCVTLIVPLVDVNEENGPTDFWPGTHRADKAKALMDDTEVHIVPRDRAAEMAGAKGDAIVFDTRTVHRGGANRGKERRPILYLAFARPWYTERQRNFAAEKLFE